MSAFANEYDAAVLYDGSGSMQGFYRAHSITNLNENLHDILTGLGFAVKSSVFVSENDTSLIPLSEFINDPHPPWGPTTRLDEALSLVMEKQIIVFVTDNVQDTGEDKYSSTRSFYDMLDYDSVHAVLLLPIRKPFDGILDFDKNRYPNSDKLIEDLKKKNNESIIFSKAENNKKYNKINMKGEKSLAVYFIFNQMLPKKQMDYFMEAVQSNCNVEPFIVKPINQGKFIIKGVNNKTIVENAFSLLEETCNPRDSEVFSRPRPNCALEEPPSGIYSPIFKTSENNYGLYLVSKKDKFLLNKTNSLRFYFSLLNKSRAIDLAGIKGDCKKDVRITLADLQYSLPHSLHKMVRAKQSIKGGIIPPFIPYNVSHVTDYTLENNQLSVFFTEIKMPAYETLISLKSLYRFAFLSYVPAMVKGRINVSVPIGNISITKDYAKKYFTKSELDQSRIFTPVDIVHYISKKPVELRFDFVSKNIELQPPLWIKIPVYLFLIFILLVTVYIAISIMTRHYLLFEDNGKAIEVYLPFPFTKRQYAREGETIFYVYRGFIYYFIKCPNYCNLKIDDIPTNSVMIRLNSSFIIENSHMKIVVEPVDYGKYSNVEHEELSIVEKKKKKKEKEEKTNYPDNDYSNMFD